MAVYVDNARRPYLGMRMCHMIADSRAELLAMVDRIGVDRRHIQYPGLAKEHFDICAAKRDLALSAGAQAVTTRELARMLIARAVAGSPDAL